MSFGIPNVGQVERAIERVEGFRLRLLHPHGRDVRSDRTNLPRYGYRRALRGNASVRHLEGLPVSAELFWLGDRGSRSERSARQAPVLERDGSRASSDRANKRGLATSLSRARRFSRGRSAALPSALPPEHCGPRCLNPDSTVSTCHLSAVLVLCGPAPAPWAGFADQGPLITWSIGAFSNAVSGVARGALLGDARRGLEACHPSCRWRRGAEGRASPPSESRPVIPPSRLASLWRQVRRD